MHKYLRCCSDATPMLLRYCSGSSESHHRSKIHKPPYITEVGGLKREPAPHSRSALRAGAVTHWLPSHSMRPLPGGASNTAEACMREQRVIYVSMRFGPILTPPSGHSQRQWITVASTLILVVVLLHVVRRAFGCGKTTTNNRVDAAVIHYLLKAPLVWHSLG